MFHDSDLKKLAGLDLKIWDATMADLKNIDIGSWFIPEFRNQRVPTLAQVLDVCRDKIGVDIELKYYGHDQNLEQRVIDIVEAHGMAAAFPPGLTGATGLTAPRGPVTVFAPAFRLMPQVRRHCAAVVRSLPAGVQKRSACAPALRRYPGNPPIFRYVAPVA